MATTFADRLAAAIDRSGSPTCVGLDPVYEKLPAELRCGTSGGSPVAAIARFCEGVLEAAKGAIPCVKPQSACFERYGAEGVACLQHVCRRAKELGFIVVLDAKRGDIGISAEHYAAAAFGESGCGADAVTLSPYLGPDTIEPYLSDETRGVFVLVRTSNPGSDAVQSERLAGPAGGGRTVAEMIADQVAHLGSSRRGASGLSSVGAVVGATKAADAAELRARMGDQVFLVPGYGAQGGTAEDIRGMLRRSRTSMGTSGVLVTASRSVIYPVSGGGDWRGAIEEAARRLALEVAGVVR